jgi:CDP-2,3-bis-(O-geranylgeranyl)-sn-glycerol synthase
VASVDSLSCALFLVGSFFVAAIAQTIWLRSRCSRRLAVPIDFGRTLRGKRIFGDNKTPRGFVVMVPATALAFALFHHLLGAIDSSWVAGIWPLTDAEYLALGALAGLGFMLGELPNSFVKRQLGIPPGHAARGGFARTLSFVFDRLDSILGALLAQSLVVPTPWKMWTLVLLIGPVVHGLFSVALFWLRVKPRWA